MCSTGTILTIHHQLKGNLISLLLLLIHPRIDATAWPSFFPALYALLEPLSPENIFQSPLGIDLMGQSFLTNRNGIKKISNLAFLAKRKHRN